MKTEHENELKINNVFLGSYGYRIPYNEHERPYSKDLQESLIPYVEKGLLKTDFDSLRKVAEILYHYTGELVVIDEEGTITFFDADY